MELSCYQDDRVVLTVVLPLYNEAPIIHLVHQRLTAVMAAMDIRYELLFVDDGSTDHTAQALADLSATDPSVTTVFLGGHFGKESALAAGLAQASGQAAIIMDADLQDPPERIPDMLAAWRQGADVVLMRRRPRTDGWLPGRLAQRGLDHLLHIIGDTDLPERSVDFMLYNQKAVAALSLLVHRKRFMKSMFSWVGLRQTLIDYDRQPRVGGSSKWAVSSFLGAAPDGSFCPLHALLRTLMSLGLAGMVAGLAYACYAALAAASAATFAPSVWMSIGASLLYFAAWLGKYMIQIYPPAKRPARVTRKRVRSNMASP